jgi:hypothetical protein
MWKTTILALQKIWMGMTFFRIVLWLLLLLLALPAFLSVQVLVGMVEDLLHSLPILQPRMWMDPPRQMAKLLQGKNPHLCLHLRMPTRFLVVRTQYNWEDR